ncbi:MAG TPA: chemotaxis protein CheB [Rhodocyclaceae bacterium]
MASSRKFSAVAIGVSSGGVQALKLLLGELPRDYPLPILIVQHISPDAGNGMAKLLDDLCAIRIKEADEQDRIVPATVYLAPPNYHLLVEREGFLSLSADPPVSYARPSVDVLFESAAAVFGPQLVAIVLTGANWDGARGVQAVKRRGGVVIVQDPADADTPQMPQAALAAVDVDHVVPLAAMPALLRRLAGLAAHPAEAGHG